MVVSQATAVIVVALILVGAGLAFWLGRNYYRLASQHQATYSRLEKSQKTILDLRNRLESIHLLNLRMVEAGNDRAMVESVLDILGELVGAGGCSFIPFDEWGEPLPAISRGRLPGPVLQAWSDHLATNEVRERCKNCQELSASGNGNCPLMINPYPQILNVQCIPIRRDGRVIGMMNLYMQASPEFDGETRKFIEDIANELAVAVESNRLRQQELTTLRQLQMNRPASLDPEIALNAFLEEVKKAVKGDFALLVVQPVTESQPRLVLQTGLSSLSIPKSIAQILSTAVSESRGVHLDSLKEESLFSKGEGDLIAVPLSLPDKPAFGALILGSSNIAGSIAGYQDFLNAAARQAALLIELSQRMNGLEYSSVVKERARLAREIHDGLAQTLAFLKLQTGQMQNYLNRGDLPRLTQALQMNYHTLSEAYLDIRQSIDNLRLTPAQGIETWLEQLAGDFMKTTGMKVILDTKLPAEVRDRLSAEIQAQLIRIIQEALSNVRKHAHGERVWISMRGWNDDIILEVRDDGQGFSPKDIPGVSQYGLRGMRERAELIGADFQIISQPHLGTTVRISLPYPLEETLA